jgi:hypothetical protein
MTDVLNGLEGLEGLEDAESEKHKESRSCQTWLSERMQRSPTAIITDNRSRNLLNEKDDVLV